MNIIRNMLQSDINPLLLKKLRHLPGFRASDRLLYASGHSGVTPWLVHPGGAGRLL